METIKQISDKLKLTTLRQNGQSDFSQADTEFVNDLFRELKSCFPAWGVAIKSGAQQDETKRQWVKAFKENGINTKELVEIGMKEARKQPTDFFPSTGKFVSWCKPPVHWAHRTQEKAALIPKMNWLEDKGSVARIKAAAEATLARARAPSKKLTKEETDAMLKSLDR